MKKPHGMAGQKNATKDITKSVRLKENLKACPFCGGWSDFGIGESGSHCVVCNNCFACSEHFETEQKAQEAWNKRMVDE